jgi:hypothetical protein
MVHGIDADASIARLWDAFVDLVGPLASHLFDVADPLVAAAFLAGGTAALAGARLALFGAAVVVVGHLGVAFGAISEIPDWTMPLAVVLFLLGLAQGILTLVVGEQTAGTLLVAVVVGAILFLLWRGPARAVRLLGGLAVRVARR